MSAARATQRPARARKPGQNVKMRPFNFIHPCQCRHQADHSEILACVEATGAWETFAVIKPTGGASPEAIAEFLCFLINDVQKNRNLLFDAVEALETCLEEGTLTFSSEQAADIVVTRIKKIMK
jgi:hypothetical protein